MASWTHLPLNIEAASGGLVYATDTNTSQTIYALDARSGALRWEQHVPLAIGTIPVAAGGVLVAGEAWPANGSANIYGLNAATGAILWHLPLIETPSNGGMSAIADGTAFVGTNDGLEALDASTGARQAAGAAKPSPR